MKREQAFETALQAIAKIQKNVSVILEAKAAEAEKARNWILHHVHEASFPAHSDRLSVCLQIHEQQIEVIDGLTKLCNGLSRNLKVLLSSGDEEGQAAVSDE